MPYIPARALPGASRPSLRRPLRLVLPAAVLALAALGVRPSLGAPRVEDTMAQRLVACTACHGKEGRAGPDGYYPRIAGKPAGYLYNQLLNFRDGRRHYGLMVGLLNTLSDDYLRQIAGHFASLDLPYPPPPAPQADPETLARGEVLARQGDPAREIPSCASCHGAALTGVAPAIPGLLGLPRDYLNAQIGAWRTGQRRAQAPDCMGEIARRLAPEDIAAVTAWLASRPLPQGSAKPMTSVADLPAPLPFACGGLQEPAR